MPFDSSEYIQRVPGLIETFRPVSDSVLLPLTKSYVRHLRAFDNKEEIIETLDRSAAIAGWYREKFRNAHYWRFVLEGFVLVDLTPPEPQDEDDRFDALMSLDWEEIPEGLRERLSSVGYSQECTGSEDDDALKKRIRKDWSSYHLPFTPSLYGFSTAQLYELVRILFIPKAYPQFKDRIHSLLLQFRQE